MGTLALRFDDRLLRRALAISLAAHLLFALFLPIWTPMESAGLQPIESLSFAHISRAQIVHPAAAALPVAVPRRVKTAPHVALAKTHAEITAKTRSKRAVRPKQTGPSGLQTATAPRRTKFSAAAPLIAQAPASDRPSVNTPNSAQQTPNPQASVDTRSAASSGATDRGGVMPYGAKAETPVLDPSVRAQLAKLARSHVTLVIVVDEDGKTKSVTFDPPLDADTESQMRALLASAAWDPAYCGGGVSCEGTATLRF